MYGACSKPRGCKASYYLAIGWSEDRQNVLRKTRQGRFRQIRETLIGTVAMNYSILVSLTPFYFPLWYLFHVQNDPGLTLLRGARYFRILLINPCWERCGLTRHAFFSEYAIENLLAWESYLCPGLTFTFIRLHVVPSSNFLMLRV